MPPSRFNSLPSAVMVKCRFFTSSVSVHHILSIIRLFCKIISYVKRANDFITRIRIHDLEAIIGIRRYIKTVPVATACTFSIMELPCSIVEPDNTETETKLEFRLGI